MFEKYEGLTADENAEVPDTSYKNAKAYLVITNSNADENDTNKTE